MEFLTFFRTAAFVADLLQNSFSEQTYSKSSVHSNSNYCVFFVVHMLPRTVSYQQEPDVQIEIICASIIVLGSFLTLASYSTQ